MNLNKKIILDKDKLKCLIEAEKTLGKKIVCTIGSWDILHIGHVRYLHTAKNLGDILLVGVDSDRAIKIYKKNELRPIIPETERMEMLSYQSFVDYVTLVDDVDELGNWQLEIIKLSKPHLFVCTTESYPEEQRQEMQKHCQELKVLDRQAGGTSTSNIIEKTIKSHLDYFLKNVKI